VFGLLFIAALLGNSACSHTSHTQIQSNTSTATNEVLFNKGTVAVADLGVEHPSAKLVFNKDAARDVLTSSASRHRGFTIIDWARLSAVLFRRNLEWSDVSDEDDQRQELQEVLLNDYFLVGSVTSYGEHMEYQASAFSKSKMQIVKVQLDLFLKDAITNEIVASSRSHANAQRKLTQSLGFGAAGGSDPTLALEALSRAADQGVVDIYEQLVKEENK
jgi:curli biogenesis system outer membrane secretion channel CsgG